jgi:hypothetical protein
MKVLERIPWGVEVLPDLRPENLKRLAGERLTDLVRREMPRARNRVLELEKRYPSAPPRELAQRLIDDKKSVARMVGGITGVFGVFAIPPDLLVMAWLELMLLVDIATVYKVNLKSDTSCNEVLDLFGESNGIGPLTRSAPRALGSVVGLILARGPVKAAGRAVPVLAAPLSAWLNNRHIQRVGDAAARHYEGFGKARRKAGREV